MIYITIFSVLRVNGTLERVIIRIGIYFEKIYYYSHIVSQYL